MSTTPYPSPARGWLVAVGLVATVFAVTAHAVESAPRILTLEEAVALALQQQPTLRQAQATIGIAEGRREQIRAPLLPQLSGSASYGLSGGSSLRGTPEEGKRSATLLGLNAGVSQTIWDFQAIERFRASGRTVDAQRASERATRLQVTLDVRGAFFAARAQRSLLRVAEETLANQLKHKQQIDGFVRVGIRPEIDLAQSATDVANARLQFVNARNGYRVAKAQLRQAIGLPDSNDFEVADDELAPMSEEGAPLDRLVQQAIDARPELLSLQKQQEAQALTVSAARAGYLPSVGASAGVAEIGPGFDQLVFGWNAGVVLTWTPFAGGVVGGQIREAEATARGLDAQLDTQRLQVRLEVEQAALSVEDDKSAIEAAKEAEAAARKQLQLAEGRYTAGVGSIIELGDAQVALTTAANQLVQTQLNLSIARAQLQAALGHLP